MKHRNPLDKDADNRIKVEKLNDNLYVALDESQLEEVKGFLDGHGYACSSEQSSGSSENKGCKIKITSTQETVDSDQLVVQKLLDSLGEVSAFDDSDNKVIRADQAE